MTSLLTSLEFPSNLDNTTVTAYRQCPKKFWWRHLQLLQRGELSIHLVSGGAFAKGLEVARKRYYDFGDDFETALLKGAAALIAAYGYVDPHPRYAAKSVWNMVGALAYYFETWPVNRLLTPWRPTPQSNHCIEWNFAIPIPGMVNPSTGQPILYCGRFDMVGVTETGLRLGEDDKTTSQLGDQWMNRWRLPNQILGYGWGTREHGIKLDGFVIRGVSLLKNSYGNAEVTLMLNDWQLNRFLANLQLTVARMIEDFKSNRFEFDLGPSCSAYGGCDYLPLCESPEPENWIEPNYTINKWDPLHSRD